MNAAATLRRYYEERIQSIAAILQKPHSAISGDDIHELRVEIKKLRALAQLVQYCAKDFPKKKFLKPYNKIFKEAGYVRELQIEVSLFKKLDVTDNMKHYRKELNKHIKKAKHHFTALLGKSLRHQVAASSKHMLPYVVAVQENQIQEFLQTRSLEMDRLTVHGHLKKMEAHELRRQLKVFYYVLLMFEAKDNRFKKIDAFQELLGQWHDDVITTAYLQQAVASGALHHAEKRHMRVAKDKVADEGRRLFKDINNRLADFRRTKQQTFQGTHMYAFQGR